MPRTKRQDIVRRFQSVDKLALRTYYYTQSLYRDAQRNQHSEIITELEEIRDMLQTISLKAQHCVNVINGVAH